MPLGVEFHTGLADVLGYACRLLRKAHRQSLRVLVTAPEGLLSALDRELWTFEEREFVPHQRWRAGTAAERIELTPIWLAEHADAPVCCSVLVNLGADLPDPALEFDRIIELVSHEPDEAASGRLRWRQWKERGLAPSHRNAPGA